MFVISCKKHKIEKKNYFKLLAEASEKASPGGRKLSPPSQVFKVAVPIRVAQPFLKLICTYILKVALKF